MECPAQVQKALERIQLNTNSKADENLVVAWLDWHMPHQMSDAEKWQSPAKRLKSSEGESPNCTAR